MDYDKTISSLGDIRIGSGATIEAICLSQETCSKKIHFSAPFFIFFKSQILVCLLCILSFRRQPASATTNSHSCNTEPHRRSTTMEKSYTQAETVTKINLSTFDIAYDRDLPQDVTHYCSIRRMWRTKQKAKLSLCLRNLFHN